MPVSAEGRVEHQKLNQVEAGPHLVEFLVFNSITHVIKKRGVDRSVPRWFILKVYLKISLLLERSFVEKLTILLKFVFLRNNF